MIVLWIYLAVLVPLMALAVPLTEVGLARGRIDNEDRVMAIVLTAAWPWTLIVGSFALVVYVLYLIFSWPARAYLKRN